MCSFTSTFPPPLSQILDLSYCDFLNDASIACVSHLPHLHTLKLYHSHGVTDRAMPHLTRIKRLHTLDLSYCNLITDVGMASIATCATLTSLSLMWCNRITGKHGQMHGHVRVHVLVTHCVYLYCILFTHTLSPSDIGIHHLTRLPHLSHLSLPYCRALTNASMQSLARVTKLTYVDLTSVEKMTDVGE